MMDKIAQLEDRIVELEAICSDITERYIGSEKRNKLSTQRAKIWGSLAACALIAGVLISPGNKAIAQGYGGSLHQLITDVNTLKTQMSTEQSKTKYMSTSGTTTTFTACNVQIVNGLGTTDGDINDPLGNGPVITNGLGNLIIGYNANDGQPVSGSHNLILGDYNGYTSIGGIVDGQFNTISAPYASITGGTNNTASGMLATVSGGRFNLASGNSASVSGGSNNNASGSFASVTSGLFNDASGIGSSITGGQRNSATNFATSIAGGDSNIAPGSVSSCLGGYLCRSDDAYSAVLGGYNTTVNTGSDYTHFP